MLRRGGGRALRRRVEVSLLVDRLVKGLQSTADYSRDDRN